MFPAGFAGQVIPNKDPTVWPYGARPPPRYSSKYINIKKAESDIKSYIKNVCFCDKTIRVWKLSNSFVRGYSTPTKFLTNLLKITLIWTLSFSYNFSFSSQAKAGFKPSNSGLVVEWSTTVLPPLALLKWTWALPIPMLAIIIKDLLTRWDLVLE